MRYIYSCLTLHFDIENTFVAGIAARNLNNGSALFSMKHSIFVYLIIDNTRIYYTGRSDISNISAYVLLILIKRVAKMRLNARFAEHLLLFFCNDYSKCNLTGALLLVVYNITLT